LNHHLRRDRWLNGFAFVVSALWWWNPIAWWARREISTAQELCCDAMALSGRAAKRSQYAATLWQVVEFLDREAPHFHRKPRAIPIVGSSFGRNGLRQRFERIADARVNHRWSTWMTCAALIVMATLPCMPVRRAELAAEETQANPKSGEADKDLPPTKQEPPETRKENNAKDTNAKKINAKKINAKEDRPAKQVKCTLTFVQGDQGKSMPSAPIEIAQRGDEPLKWKTVLTNKVGELAIDVDDGTRLFLRLKSNDQWCDRWIVGATEKSHDHVVRVWDGSPVSGRLLEPNGEPAANVTLAVAAHIQGAVWKKRLGLTTNTFQDSGEHGNWMTYVRTAADGRFSFTAPTRPPCCGYELGLHRCAPAHGSALRNLRLPRSKCNG